MPKLNCPFCGAPETERLVMDERLVVVFPCMFSPVLEASAKEERQRVEAATIIPADFADGRGCLRTAFISVIRGNARC